MPFSTPPLVSLDPILTDCILSSCPTPETAHRIQFSERNRCILATQGTFIAKTLYRAKYHLLEYLAAKEFGAQTTGSGPSSISSGATTSTDKNKRKRRLAMMQNKRVKFKICVIGMGSLGGMLLEGLLSIAGDLFSPKDVIVVTRRKDQHLEQLVTHHGISREAANQIVVTQNLRWAVKQCDLVYLCVLPSQFQYLDFDPDDEEMNASTRTTPAPHDSSLSLMEGLLNRKKSVVQSTLSKKNTPSHETPSNLYNKNKVFVSFVSGIPLRKVCNTVHSELVLTLQLSHNQKFKSQFSQLTNFRRNLREVLQNALFVRFASPHDCLDAAPQNNSSAKHHLWLKEQFYPVMARFLLQQSGLSSSTSVHTHHLIAMAIDHCTGCHASSEHIDRVFQSFLRKNFMEKNSSLFWMEGDFLEECLVLEMRRQRELEMKRQSAVLRPAAQFLQQDTLGEYKHVTPGGGEENASENSMPLSPSRQSKPPNALFEQNLFLKWFQELVYCKS